MITQIKILYLYELAITYARRDANQIGLPPDLWSNDVPLDQHTPRGHVGRGRQCTLGLKKGGMLDVICC